MLRPDSAGGRYRGDVPAYVVDAAQVIMAQNAPAIALLADLTALPSWAEHDVRPAPRYRWASPTRSSATST